MLVGLSRTARKGFTTEGSTISDARLIVAFLTGIPLKTLIFFGLSSNISS